MENKHLSPAVWFSIILVAAFLVGYLAWAYSTFNWPFDGTIFPYPEHKREPRVCTRDVRACPDGTSVGRVPPACEFATCPGEAQAEANNWKTYRNEEYGFEVKYPAEWIISEEGKPFGGKMDILTLVSNESFARNEPRKGIVIRPIFLKDPVQFKEVLVNDVIFDGSGLHPESFNEFEGRRIGSYSFYFMRTGLFEGILSLNYYLVHKDNILVFELISRGVDWTNPKFDSENDLGHLALKKILSTFRFVE